jgi:DNA-binding response OmpR family regulator
MYCYSWAYGVACGEAKLEWILETPLQDKIGYIELLPAPNHSRNALIRVTMSIRVLLVDDEIDFVAILGERLTARGLSVQIALSGDEALAKLRQKQIDVVVLDISMPGMSGIEALGQMKEIRPSIKVIMLTGYGSIDSGLQGLKLGADNYLMKPVETEDLVAKIRNACSKSTEEP